MRLKSKLIQIAAVVAVLVGSIVASGSDAIAKAGCAPGDKGGEWPSFGGDLSNSRSQPVEKKIGPAEAPHLEPRWTFSVASAGADGNFQSTPAVSDGCAFVATSTGWVFAVNAETGKLVWKTKGGKAGSLGGIFGLAVARGKVYANVSGPDGPFAVALDQDSGDVVWKSGVLDNYPGAWTNSSAVVYRDLMFFGISAPEGDAKGRGSFAILDADTGRVLEHTYVMSKKDVKNGMAGAGIWSTAAVDEHSGYAYVGAGNPYGPEEHRRTNAILKIDLNRERPTFGDIVDSYKGDVDQYFPPLAVLDDTPACTEEVIPPTLDRPQCGQIDLDFGASPNLFRNSAGELMVGALQKSGVYHAAYADTMEKAWSTVVGAPCAVCNVSSSAYDGKDTIYAAGSPGSVMVALDRDDGAYRWISPIVDGTHYQPVGVANGVVYAVDTTGALDTFDAATGLPTFTRPMALDTADPCVTLSGSLAIAGGMVYAHCDLGVTGGGWLIAYGYDDE